jgi:hypothetical protein
VSLSMTLNLIYFLTSGIHNSDGTTVEEEAENTTTQRTDMMIVKLDDAGERSGANYPVSA